MTIPPPETAATPISLPDSLSREYLLHHRLCPVGVTRDGGIAIATAPGFAPHAVEDVAALYRRMAVAQSVSEADLVAHIERAVAVRGGTSENLQISVEEEDAGPDADIRDLASQAPVVRYVNLLIRDASDSGASDIHLEATRSGLTARFRLDGVLVPAQDPPATLHHAVVSRVKLMAKLDIAERRKPQDGRIRIRLDEHELDLRVSTVPTTHGESVVLRLLDRGAQLVDLAELGLRADDQAALERLVRRPHGLVLVTGPTGGGKTTTLYGALQKRDAGREKIITIEDPVEYQLSGITQMPIHRQAGVTFASALRAILRQDPDVVMVGEMRDAETAEIAVQAAMTGHLVLSTLHTNDALGAIPRLLDLGVPEYLVSATLDGVLAQRLVRRVCRDCAVSYTPDADLVAALAVRPTGRPRHLRGAGCPACRGTGFRGRLGVFELLTITDDLRNAITRRLPKNELQELARADGFRSMREDAWAKCEAGLTTIEESLRVLQH